MDFEDMRQRARVLTLADAYDVDLSAAFTSTMDELDEVLAAG